MALRLVVDKYGVYEGAPTHSVSSREDYLAARTWLATANGQLPSGTIVVSKPAMDSWFDDIADCRDVTHETLDPRRELKGALRCSALPTLLDEDPGTIVNAGLLQLAKSDPRGAAEDVGDWLLRVLIGHPWDYHDLRTPRDLREVVTACANDAVGAPPLVGALRKQRLQHWAERAGAFRAVLRWVSGAPQRRSQALLLAQMLHSYPLEITEEVLGSVGLWQDICALADWRSWVDRAALGRSPPTSVMRPQASAKLRNALRDVLSGQGGIKRACQMMSGWLDAELQVVWEYMCDRAEARQPLGQQEAQAVRNVFAPNAQASHVLRLTEQLEERSVPVPLSIEASWDELTSWLTNDYLPFYAQRSLAGDLADTVPLVESFEDWLISHYWGLSLADERLGISFARITERAARQGPCLVVVIDGLGWEWAATLAELASDEGLSLRSPPRLLLSPVPSITSVSKLAMLAGQMPSQLRADAPGLEAYRDALSRALQCSSEKIAVGSDRESDLHTTVGQGTPVCLFLYNAIDSDAIHLALSEFRRRAKMEKTLANIARELAEAAEALTQMHGESRPVTILVSADHGYTVLPRANDRGLDVPDDGVACHGRVLLGRMDNVNPEDAFVAKSADFLLPEDVAIARGYNFFGPRPRGAVHGGMTPQELAVPLLVMSAAAPPHIVDLHVEFSGEPHRQRSDNLVTATVLNPNDYPVRLMSLKLRLAQLVSKLPVSVEPDGEATLELLVDASDVRSETVRLVGSITFEVFGQMRTVELDETIRTIGAAITPTDFDSMFGDA